MTKLIHHPPIRFQFQPFGSKSVSKWPFSRKPISISRSSNSVPKSRFSRKRWALKNHFEEVLTKFLQMNVGKINSSSSIRVQFQPLEVRILSQNGFFHESSKRSKITLKRFWPNFFIWMLAKLIHDIPKFTVHISMNSNSESLSFKFSLKAPFCQKQIAFKSYFQLCLKEFLE